MAYDSIFKPDLFAGQNIIVTGGGSGIGRCTAHELAALGAHVLLVGRNAEKLKKVAAEITEDGGKASWQVCDIRDEDAVTRLVSELIRKHGPIHGLVNNAGGQYPSPLASINQKGFETILRTNLVGGFLMAREVFNQSMSKHGGAIVNMLADMWGGMPGMGHSGAARSGMDNFTKTAAFELGLCRRAGQRRRAGLGRLQRHGHLRRRVPGRDPDLVRTRTAQTHRHRIGNQRGDCFPAQPGSGVCQRQYIAHRRCRQPRRAGLADAQGAEQSLVQRLSPRLSTRGTPT